MFFSQQEFFLTVRKKLLCQEKKLCREKSFAARKKKPHCIKKKLLSRRKHFRECSYSSNKQGKVPNLQKRASPESVFPMTIQWKEITDVVPLGTQWILEAKDRHLITCSENVRSGIPLTLFARVHCPLYLPKWRSASVSYILAAVPLTQFSSVV